MYRTPSEIVEDINNFTTEFATLLSHMKAIRHSSYVCGDYNIDLLKVKRNKHYCEYFDEIISHGFIPKITLPTRISEHSSTLTHEGPSIEILHTKIIFYKIPSILSIHTNLKFFFVRPIS